VKARKVGDSVVVTITRPALEEAEIAEGDSLVLEALGRGKILISKEVPSMSLPQTLQLELDILESRKAAIEAEMALAVHEHNKSMPTAHPGIEDSDIMEGASREWNWELRKLDVEIAQKRLDLFKLTGFSEKERESK